MKRINGRHTVWSLPLLLGLLLLTGCGNDRFESEALEFSIQFPDNWQQSQEPGMESQVLASSLMESPDDPFRAYTLVASRRFDTPIDLDAWETMLVNNLSAPGRNYTQESREDSTLDGAPARRLIYRNVTSNTDVRTLLYLTVRGQQAYAIASVALPDRFDDYQPVFETTAKSFRFK